MTSSAANSLPLDGKLALVTGATHGIGRAIALGLARSGARVAAAGRTQGALESLDDEIRSAGGLPPSLVTVDIRDGAAVDRLGAALYERWQRLDVLIAAAGVLGVLTPVAHLDQKVWDEVMAVNVTANYRLIRSMDPLLRRSDAGRAVFLSSSVAKRPRAFWGAYAASKAALETIARTYADEVDDTPIRVAVVNPGPMRTRMRMKAYPGEDPESLPPPEAIVPLILELVGPGSSPDAATVDFARWSGRSG